MEQDTFPPSLPAQAALTFLLLQAEEAAAGSTAAKALEQLQGSHSSMVGCLDAAAAQGRQGACRGTLVHATTVSATADGSGLAHVLATPSLCQNLHPNFTLLAGVVKVRLVQAGTTATCN